MSVRKLFRLRVKRTRERMNLTQEELACVAGLSKTTLSHFETGTRTPSLENLVKLADGLDVSIDYLVGRNSGRKETNGWN